jgi:hypothetical protein
MKPDSLTAPGETTVTSFSVLDQPVSLRSSCAEAHAALSGLYRRTPRAADPPQSHVAELVQTAGGTWEARSPSLPPAPSPSLGEALQRVEADFCTHALRFATDRVGLHAATIRFGERWALISGDSGAGKTTLTLALSARGCRLDGDDVATLDPESGLVQGLPRCFHLDEFSIELLLKEGLDVRRLERLRGFLTPADIGDAGMVPRAVAAVFFLSAGEGVEPALMPITLAEAVVAMETQTGPHHRPSAQHYPLLAKMLQRARCFQLRRGAPGATANLVMDTMRGMNE